VIDLRGMATRRAGPGLADDKKGIKIFGRFYAEIRRIFHHKDLCDSRMCCCH
jgi:hypothetical protein